MAKRGPKVDNSDVGIDLKVRLRQRMLPQSARVLDLFCGTGEMYRGAYQSRVEEYVGVDKEKVHDEACCFVEDNRAWVQANNLERFNVFDLDAYGCPWALLFLVMAKARQPEVTVFLTDGTALLEKIDTRPSRMVKAACGIPVGMKIPSLYFWRADNRKTMLIRLEERTGYRAVAGLSAVNHGHTVDYLGVRFQAQKSASLR